jgi:glycosyltransferase involved in cell wall biosynthesis
VLDDRELSAALSRRGRERAAGYSWRRAARRTLEIYEEAAA